MLGLIVIAGTVYQIAGRDIRTDLHAWYQKLTIEELIALAVRLGEIAGILAAGWFGVRLVRRIRLWLELKARERFAGPNNEQPLQGWQVPLAKITYRTEVGPVQSCHSHEVHPFLASLGDATRRLHADRNASRPGCLFKKLAQTLQAWQPCYL